MAFKKFMMWLFVFLTIITIYAMFNYSSVPLLFAYLIYPFIGAIGFTIAGLFGRKSITGKIILKAVIFSFSVFSIIGLVAGLIGGFGIFFWAAIVFPSISTILFILGLIIYGCRYIGVKT